MINKEFELDILGVRYKIFYLNEKDGHMKNENSIGYCDFESKKIFILEKEDFNYNGITERHELIHAFLYESGIETGCGIHDEYNVNYLAVQLPKIVRLVKEMERKSKKYD